MKKTWKRILCLTLALLSVATLFAGCNRGGGEVED